MRSSNLGSCIILLDLRPGIGKLQGPKMEDICPHFLAGLGNMVAAHDRQQIVGAAG